MKRAIRAIPPPSTQNQARLVLQPLATEQHQAVLQGLHIQMVHLSPVTRRAPCDKPQDQKIRSSDGEAAEVTEVGEVFQTDSAISLKHHA